MPGGRTIYRIAGLSALALAALLGQPAGAEEIAVGNYGVAPTACRSASLAPRASSSRRVSTSPASSRRPAAAPRCATCSPAACPMARSIPASSSPPSSRAPTSRSSATTCSTVAEFVWAVKPDSPIKIDPGLQGQEDRLHQSALDEPGARHAAAAAGRPQDGRRRAREDRRLRRGHRRARYRARSTWRRSPSRCGRSSNRSTARSPGPASYCRLSTTWSA